LIVVGRKRSGQVSRRRRKVIGADEFGRNGMAVGGQIVEQPSKAKQIAAAGLV
jgi:hypothetical protein